MVYKKIKIIQYFLIFIKLIMNKKYLVMNKTRSFLLLRLKNQK